MQLTPGIAIIAANKWYLALHVLMPACVTFQILDGQSLAKLGSLVAGLNSSTVRNLPPEVILEAIKLPEFVQQMATLPSPLKMAFVEKVKLFFSSSGVIN